MAKVILAIPEENLEEVINIIKLGMMLYRDFYDELLSDEVSANLQKWCADENEYLDSLGE